jgi:UDP-N-acetylmuramyl pentapeptide synthase
LVLDIDSPRAMSLAAKTKARVITYGFSAEAHFVASHPEIIYGESNVPEGILFKVNHGARSVPVRITGTVGMHHAYPVLAAIAVGVSEGGNLLSVAQWIEEDYTPPPGRLRIIQGLSEGIILDDTYNASPSATQAALGALEDVKAKRKIAILGDMMELGKHSVEEHQKIGETVSKRRTSFCRGASHARSGKRSRCKRNERYTDVR